MADTNKRLSTNVDGSFFVDSTCINCDTCRQLAPITFQETGEYSAVYHQPESSPEVIEAYRALLACPVGSIGTVTKDKNCLTEAQTSFPFHLDGNVYYNGFNSEKSFGANSYFIQHRDGNWLVDSPRYVGHLVKAFERMGGVKYIFLSHEDDVADSDRYADKFHAARIIHEADAGAVPGAEWIVNECDRVQVDSEFQLIPVPGHTAGSMALLYMDAFLFTGDHLWWNRDTKSLDMPSVLVWNKKRLLQSTQRLLEYSFEWVLPGHGDRIRLSPAQIKIELDQLLQHRRIVDSPDLQRA